ncbi:hypothetical protein QZH41_002301 [Actinostola sp. cb2023]|nr:hypothetical protein QZH41_002301 [Actinostola sp. cb2023]
MSHRHVFLLVVLLNTLVFCNCKPWYSYGSKTPYRPGKLQAINEPTGCNTVHLNMVLRHGSRYPCSNTAQTIFKLVEQVNKVHESKPHTFKNLTIPWQLPKEYRIAGNCEQADAGNEEIFLLAKRFRVQYPSLFEVKYWNAYYSFETSDTPRTGKSAVAFGMGLFDGNGTLGIAKYQPIAIKVSGPKNSDRKLRYYDACARYVKEIKEGTGLDQWKEFGLGSEMKKVISNIEERLNLKGKVSLNADMVEKMFWLCAFATMNNLRRDWCSVFDQEDMNTLEYYDDINQYYRHSYGNQVSYKTNCPIVSDIIDSLNTFVNGKLGHPYGIFRFTHIGSMIALQSILGMYKDPYKLMANNFAQTTNRTFRISRNVPMAANLAFVLYRCGKEFKVQVLMNEKPAALPCCNGQSVCALKTFMSCYEDIGKNCDFEAMWEQEAYLLGKRFRVRFQALFTRKYWNRYYEFVTTDKQRTARTASAFSYGIFEGNGTLGNAKYQPIAIKFSGPKDNDKLLRYHAACPKYGKEIEDGTGLDELKKFGVGTEMKRVISNIEERLQLQGKINLTAEDAKDLFMLCAFATLNHETREWCSLFTDNDIKVFEYQSDLDNYYTHSYGNEFSYNTSCPLLGDVINTLNKFVKESVPYGIFRFAHSSTMVALQSILGMYKDPYKLMADNFEQSTNRTFRISRNVPMAANLAFVLYRCGKEFKVQVLMNERPAALPCCNGQSVCALKTFMSCYEDIGKNCDFEAMCKLSAHTASSTNLRSSVWWLTVVLVALRAL